MRKLIYIPIVHTSADMGSMKEGLKEAGMAKLGEREWIENERRIAKFWNEVEREIDALDLDYENVRLYQDGLPCAGEIGMRIINTTAAMGSRNFQILKKLIEKGAIVEATESPDLLRKEYEYIKAFVNAISKKERSDAERQYEEIKDELMEKRDAFVAKTIDATLKDGETGILFIGANHNVKSKLPDDIDIKSLD
ncbi:MAG: hypothetical protein QMD78_04995 [Methanocellales archaeon]|nr:hypothetical protein [Methanocellales archaeon]